MRILITGGFGYVGGRIARHLRHVGHQVILGTRRATAPPDWLPGAEVAVIDWHGPGLEQLCAGIDAVVHAAGMNAQDCAADPASAFLFNGLATARLVDAAARAGVATLVYFSTAHVYASPLAGTIAESTCPRNLHPYATSHLAGEHAVLHADAGGRLNGVVLRLSNAFGAPAHPDANCWMLLVTDLCREAVTRGSLTLRAAGQWRNFVTLHDVTRAVAHCLDNAAELPRPRIFNVGGNQSLRVLDIAEQIRARCTAILGFTPELRQAVGAAPDVPSHELDFRTDALRATGFHPAGDADQEIDDTLRFCQKHFAVTL